MLSVQTKKPGRAQQLMRDLKSQRHLQVMALIAVATMVIFNFTPLMGLQIAFRDYKFNLGIWNSPFVGWKHFQAILRDVNIPNVVRNTLIISSLKAFLLFPLPVGLAILLNECYGSAYKRVVQTVSYFPYFVSWPIVALLALNWFSPSTGFVNSALQSLGILREPYFFLGKPEAFYWVSLVLEIWKNTGYASIIYLAAISSVDQETIEAAVIDGTNRFQRILKITIPTILPTIMIMMILNIGSLLGGGLYGSNFQLSYNLSNSLNLDTAEIIDTYVLKIGIEKSRFSYATAISFLNSLVSGVLLVSANWVSRTFTNESLF